MNSVSSTAHLKHLFLSHRRYPCGENDVHIIGEGMYASGLGNFFGILLQIIEIRCHYYVLLTVVALTVARKERKK